MFESVIHMVLKEKVIALKHSVFELCRSPESLNSKIFFFLTIVFAALSTEDHST